MWSFFNDTIALNFTSLRPAMASVYYAVSSGARLSEEDPLVSS